MGSSTNIVKNGENFFLRKALEKIAGKPIIFDVGANRGSYSEMAIQELEQQHFTSYELHLFEPQRAAFEALSEKFKGNSSVIVNNFGLSDTAGMATIYSNQHGGALASLYKRSAVSLRKEEKVCLMTVFDYVFKNHLVKISLLKIDTEGNEKKVLSGCGSFLRPENIEVIQFEYGGTFQDAHITLKEVVRLLQKNNYSVGKISPSATDYEEDISLFAEDYEYSNYGAVKNKQYE